jgi:hypothetical protein
LISSVIEPEMIPSPIKFDKFKSSVSLEGRPGAVMLSAGEEPILIGQLLTPDGSIRVLNE